MNPTWENSKKPSFGANFDTFGPNSSCQFIFFFKNMASSVVRYHGQLSSCTVWEKNNDPILRKLGDGRTCGRTDEPTVRQKDRQAGGIS